MKKDSFEQPFLFMGFANEWVSFFPPQRIRKTHQDDAKWWFKREMLKDMH